MLFFDSKKNSEHHINTADSTRAKRLTSRHCSTSALFLKIYYLLFQKSSKFVIHISSSKLYRNIFIYTY